MEARRYILVFCTALSLLMPAACSDDAPPEKRASGPVKEQAAAKQVRGEVPKPPAKPLFVQFLLNGQPAPRQSADLPLVLSMTLANPRRDTPLALPGLGWLKPVIQPQKKLDQPPKLTWLKPELNLDSLGPGQSLRLTWVSWDKLPQGVYHLKLEGLDALVDKQASNISSLRVSPAVLEITPGQANPKELAYWQRRALALTQGAKAWLASLEDALAKEPDNHNLHFEKVQALRALGDSSKAYDELANLMVQTRKRLTGNDPKRSAHLPYYYYTALVGLRAQAQQEEKNSKQSPKP